MTPFLHALHTGTLAAWLSAGTLATVGLVMPSWVGRPELPEPPATQLIWVEPEIHTAPPGLESPPEEAPPASDDALPEMVEEAAENLPAPPEMPELADLPPLPDLPELPPEPVKKATPSANSMAVARPRPAPAVKRPAAGSRTGTAGSPSAAAAARGGGGGGSQMSQSARIAAGRMPSPAYPSAARVKGQTGTVVVEFTVGNDGRVIAARAANPSAWPLLNEAAVRAVRGWRFPPGAVMTLRRPIHFKLN